MSREILMLNTRNISHPRAGGAEVFTDLLLRELTKRGYRCTLFCSNDEASHTLDLPYTVITKGNEFTVRIWAWLNWLQSLRHQQFDVVIDQIHGIPFMTPWYVRSVPIASFIHEVAGAIWIKKLGTFLGSIGIYLESFFLRLYIPRIFLTVSSSTKEDLENLLIPKETIHILPMPLTVRPTGSLSPKPAGFTVISLGRLVPAKQIEHTIQACNLARKNIPRLRLIIVGTGDTTYEEKLRAVAREYPDLVTFTGYISEEEKIRLLTSSHVLVSSSLKEGFGINVLEAAACGTPSVGYNTEGLRDSIQDGTTGLLTKKNTPQELATNIYNLYSDKALYAQLRTQAWKRAQEFSSERTADQVETILRDRVWTK